MTLQDIYHYPVKSMGGIRLDCATVLIPGLEHDRRWMVVDGEGNFVSQRSVPEMALMGLEKREGRFWIKDKQHPEDAIAIPARGNTAPTKEVRIWDDRVTALLVDPVVDAWIQSKLKIFCQLVYMPDFVHRPVDTRYAVSNESVSFADAMPYLLISQASLDFLNAKLKVPVPMDRFRPNLVIRGTEPFEEDQWDCIEIGPVRFKVTKPCARCVMVSVDQETGASGKEPLATLASFRKAGNKILFGQNLIALNEGKISTKDLVKST
nr:MOSC domain-containing protein [Cytophagales bacterium]